MSFGADIPHEPLSNLKNKSNIRPASSNSIIGNDNNQLATYRHKVASDLITKRKRGFGCSNKNINYPVLNKPRLTSVLVTRRHLKGALLL